MGYDMHIVGDPTPDEQRQYEEAEAAFDRACAVRDGLPKEEQGTFNFDQAKKSDDIFSQDNYDGRSERFRAAQERVEETYEAMHDADASYFRLSIWDMGQYRNFMLQLGMVATDYERLDWPEYPDGVEHAEIEAVRDVLEHPDVESFLPVKTEVVEYIKAHDAYIAWHPVKLPGIALHKFCSNDGWLVTPEEIESALETYRTCSAEEVKKVVDDHLEYWCKWIEYLERAQHRSGFTIW